MAVTYEVMVDWDMTDWQATPDFSEAIDNISNDVQTLSLIRGKEVEAGNAPAATLDIRLKPGLVSKYSPWNASSVLYGKVKPWRVIRVRATNDGGSTYWPLFKGYISKLLIDPHPDNQSVCLYCTDGMDVLARQIISQDYEDRSSVTEADALGMILDAAGWSSSNRDLDADGGSLQYPATGVY